MFQSGVRLSVSSIFVNVNKTRRVFFLTLIRHAARTQCDSPGGSMQCGSFLQSNQTRTFGAGFYGLEALTGTQPTLSESTEADSN